MPDLLRLRAEEQPERIALTFLENGETEGARYSYAQLDRRVRGVAVRLREEGLQGERALLLYPPGLEFVVAFLGCLYAGVVAVPAYPPGRRRPADRLGTIVRDCRPRACLVPSAFDRLALLRSAIPELRETVEVLTDTIDEEVARAWHPVELGPDSLAFLQYTSGSTAAPKGVRVTHGNLLHNEAMISRAFEQSEESVVVGWLPLYHDMGLIGNVLQPLYAGARCVLMAPTAFLQRPVRWLRAIDRYRATTSGGPNFAYEHCVRRIPPEESVDLDLSSWRLAFNGAEPVRAESLERFAERFAPCGFRREAFYPCYGLAEGTLLVSGGEVGSGFGSLAVDAAALEGHEVRCLESASARRLVSSGRSWAEQRIAIVDPETRRALGEDRVGEIWVTGPSVADGYWNRPKASKELFDARFEGEDDGAAAFLRTGDLGFLHRGELYVTGRLKDLIILRGRNLYPQDLEATAERAHPGLRRGGGAAFAVDVEGEERLVLVHELSRRSAGAAEAVCEAVRQAVATEHEARAHDVVLVREGTILKTSSGKIRRRACRDAYLTGKLQVVASSAEALGDEPAAEPTALDPTDLVALDPAARAMAVADFLHREVARLLGRPVSAVDPRKSLGTQGLDSLAAIELGHAAATSLGVAPELDELLADLSLEEVAAGLAGRLEGARTEPSLPEASPAGTFPLTRGQSALVFLERLTPASGAYNLAAAARLRGELDLAAFQRAVARLVARHPQLRAVVEEGGDLRQRITDQGPDLLVDDAAAAGEKEVLEALRQRAFTPFDLAQGPLLRVDLRRRGPAEHLMLLAVHHVVTDFWSLSRMVEDLGRLYEIERTGEGVEPPSPERGYAEFAAAQDRWLNAPGGLASREHWLDVLAGDPPVLELPTDRPRPAVQSSDGASVPWLRPTPAADAVRELARRHGATLFMTLAAAWGALLHRLSGQEEVWIGSPTSGRSVAHFARVVGYFVNPIVLRQRFRNSPSFAEHLAAVRSSALAAFAHRDYPFALLAEALEPERDTSRSPLFQAMFILQSVPGRPELAAFALGEDGGSQMAWADLTLEPVKLPRRPVQFDLNLSIAELAQGELGGSLQYATRLFDATTVQRLAASFTTFLESAVAAPERRVGELLLLTPAEHHQLSVEWSDSRLTVAEDPFLPVSLATQVARTPETVALAMGEEELTYRELDRRSNRLAAFLEGLGAGPGEVVGLALERGPDLVVALWGVLKTGAAYLPLDPSYPSERLRFVLDDAKAFLVLTRGELAALFSGGAAKVVVLEDETERIAAASDAPPSRRVDGAQPAYLIYTSGSTGRPKGVVVPHATVTNFFAGMDRSLGVAPSGIWLAVTSVSFDISVLELLWTLTRGLTVVLRPSAIAASRLRSRRLDRGMGFSLMYFSSNVHVAPAERYRLLLEGVKLADREGFEAVWTPERHFHAFGGLFPNPSVTSAAIAAMTERVAIRAGSVVLPLHSPIRVAEEWSVVDNLSGGRVGLAVASGWQPDDFVLAPEHYAERKEVMRRGIETVRELWRGGTTTLPNGLGEEKTVSILPPPIQAELPIWVTAAGSPATFAVAGETGSSVLTHLLGQSLDDVTKKIAVYRQAFQKSGAAGRGHVTLMLHTFVGEDPERVREIVREPFTRYLATSFDLMKDLAPGQDLDALNEDDMALLLARAFDRYFKTSGLFGTPQACLDLVDRLKEMDVDEVACLIDFGVETDAVLASLADLVRVKEAANALPAEDSPKTPAEETLCAEILRRRVTHFQCTPSLARALLDDPQSAEALATLDVLMVGGEALTPDLAAELRKRLRRDARLLNMYGPTETTIWSSVAAMEGGDRVTLGRPIANTSLAVVDRHLRPVGLGVPGELLIGGDGVVRGYHHRPGLTAERFLPDFLGDAPGGRLYRTGDLVRRRPDGRLEFLGRIDHQVKIRGHRIELGEVEAAILGQPPVGQAVVVAHADQRGDPQLVAYVVPLHSGGLAEPPAERRERLLAGRSSYRLPNGLTVAHLSSPQTNAIYREIFVDDVYRRHGVTLEDGATIFDVGANIGLFTLFAHQHCRNPRIFAFEPIPPTFATLAANVELFDLGVDVMNLGISDREETARFTFYPEMAGLSGRFAEGDREATRAILRSWVERMSAERGDVAGLGEADLDDLVEEYLQSETFDCKVRALSSVIREHGVEAIDYLKIDVEGAEIQVLAGIADEDWPKIRQIVIEVHSKELLEEATAILEERGFELSADEFIPVEEAIDYVYMLYAVRPGERAAAAKNPSPVDAISGPALRAALAAELPEPMVPSQVVVLDRLPLLPNGKVDRRALPAPDAAGSGPRRVPFVPPSEGLERRIAGVWGELLGIEEVSANDNFFESGGNSLLLMQAHGRLREALDREVSLVELMRHPTVSSLARYLGNGGTAGETGEKRQKKLDDRMAKRRQAFGKKRQARRPRGGRAV